MNNNIASVLPLGWSIKPIKHIFSVLNGSTPSSEPSYWHGNIYWVSSQDIELLKQKILQDTKIKITEAGYKSCRLQLAPIQSIILTTQGSIGKIALAGVPLCTNQSCKTLVPKFQNIYADYFYFQLIVRQQELVSLAKGTRANGTIFPELKTIDLESFRLLYPPPSEQKAIAHYLEQETAKIDNLIQTKKRLLELLDEKCRTLITNTVTRGLNPNVSLENSAIEWIGKIPKHWKLIRLKNCILNIKQGWNLRQADEKEPGNQEWGILKTNAIQKGHFDDSQAKTIPVYLEIPITLEIQPGDFLIIRANHKLELLGDVCYVQNTKPRLIPSNLIYRLRLDESKLYGQFLSFLLQTHIGRLQIEVDAKMSNLSMFKISHKHILNWLLLLPPLQEQKSIVEYIENKISQINALKTTIQDTIAILEERRLAIITMAVTGQIKIKG